MTTLAKHIANLLRVCGPEAVHAVTPKPSKGKLDPLIEDMGFILTDGAGDTN